MNEQTTHADWHPGESPDWLAEAIARVRAEVAAESAGMTAVTREDGSERDEAREPVASVMRERTAPQKANTGGGGGKPRAVWEWYMGGREMTDEEYAGAIRRANRRGNVHTEEPIGRGAPTTLTVIRGGKDSAAPRPKPAMKRCEMCGGEYMANVPRQRYCSKTCGNRMSKLRRKAAG